VVKQKTKTSDSTDFRTSELSSGFYWCFSWIGSAYIIVRAKCSQMHVIPSDVLIDLLNPTSNVGLENVLTQKVLIDALIIHCHDCHVTTNLLNFTVLFLFFTINQIPSSSISLWQIMRMGKRGTLPVLFSIRSHPVFIVLSVAVAIFTVRKS
jgi:hypothetical protein